MRNNLFKLLILFIFSLIAIGLNLSLVYAETIVDQDITQDTTWTLSESPYIITSEISVYGVSDGQTATLSIEPGVEIRFRPATGIYFGNTNVYHPKLGALNAQGTASQPIIFTSDSATPQPGDWKGIYFRDFTNDELTLLDHCIIEYGGNTYNANIYFENSSPLITNSFIRQSSGVGMYLNNSSRPTLTANDCSNNMSYAISVHPNNIHKITQTTGTGNNPDGIQVRTGGVQTSATWEKQAFPYIIEADVSLAGLMTYDPSVTLTIQPGVELRFKQGAGLYVGKDVYGYPRVASLNAQGTASQPIIFTSDSATPQPGDWKGIYFTPYTQQYINVLAYCLIEYGGAVNNANVYYAYTFPMMSYCTIQYSSNYGVYLDNCSLPRITFSNIQNNSSYGVYSSNSSNVIINYSNIVNNSGGGINNTSVNYPLDARYNWWGSDTGPSGSGPGTGNSITGGIGYDPWLGSPFDPNFYLYDINVSPIEFSQSGGWAKIYSRLSQEANWDISIKNQIPEEVYSAASTGNIISHDWYGVDNLDQALPDGNYKYKLSATSLDLINNASLIGNLTLNSNLSTIAKITSPVPNELISGGSINIIGTASGANFNSYTLEYGLGSSPTQWNTIISSGTAVENDILDTWDISSLNSPVYTLRLTVRDTSDGETKDSVTVNLLYLGQTSVTPDPFSPNGDGYKDITTIVATLSQPLLSWTLNIKDFGQVLKRSFTGRGNYIIQDWDGKDEQAAVVADGLYSYKIEAEYDSSQIPCSASGSVSVDNTAPTILVTSPQEDENISGIIEITGTVEDNHFKSYTVEYGQGDSPSQWTEINSALTPVVNGTLATWDAVHFENGVYVIRVTAYDEADNKTEFFRQVAVDNIAISAVSIVPRYFNPSNNETVSINYSTDRDASITVNIYDLDNNLKRTLGPTLRNAGNNTEVWDGKDDVGQFVSDNKVYTFIIEAIIGNQFGDYIPVYIPQQVAVNNFQLNPYFNPFSNQECQINYNLPQDATVLLRIGINKTGDYEINWPIINWEIRFAGDNVEYWDGRDQNGNIVDFGEYNVLSAIWTRQLPENPLIVLGSELSIGFTVDPYLIVPYYGQFTTVKYSLPEEGTVLIRIYSPSGSLVNTLINGVVQPAGDYELTWDGSHSNGGIVEESGNYNIILDFTTSENSITKIINLSVP